MPWIFGPPFEGHPSIVEMKELRHFDVQTRAKAFKVRTEAYFLKQVDVLTSSQIWAPFPLAVMTCVGIEMIGAYKYGDALADRNGHFKHLLKDMSRRFGETQLTPEGRMEQLSVFLYKGFRNSLSHGFYGKWVFITNDSKKTATFRYSAAKCLVVLNVNWFYRRFKHAAEAYLANLTEATDETADPLLTFGKTFNRNFAAWI
jgi:hypothetical protein